MRKVWKERGQKAPVSFEEDVDGVPEDAPELSWIEQQYLLAFYMAATCRPASFGGVMPIPYLVIADVLDRNGYIGEDFRAAMFVVRKLDEAAMDILEQQAKAKEAAGK